MREKYLKIGRTIAIIIAFLFLLVFGAFFSTSSRELHSEDIQKLNDGWLIYINNNLVGTNRLPATLDANANDTITLKRTLNANFESEQTFLIRGSLQLVSVQLGDEIIYSKTFDDNIFDTYASLFHFVDIPEASQGETIEITLVSPFKDFSGTINDVYFGSPSSIQNHLFTNYGAKLVIGLIWFVISISIIIIIYIFFDKQHRYYNYLAMFGIFVSLWLIDESKILQLIVNNDFLIGSMSYVSIAAAPIVMLKFLKSKILEDDKRILSFLSVIFIINLFAIIAFHMLGIFAFFETAIITNTLNLILIIIILYRFIYHYLKTKDDKFISYFILFGIFSGFLALEIIAFVLKDFDSISIYATIGMMIEFFIVIIFGLIQIFNRNKIIYKEKIYEEIANTDQLTKAKSRFAFENDIDDLFYQSSELLAVIYFDFDDLKNINDEYGHLKGDNLLIEGYHTIKEVFNSSGETYRIGGDEFACLSTKLTKDDFKKAKIAFKKKIQLLSKKLDFDVIISLGYARKDESIDDKPSDLIHRADQAMYKDKHQNKNKTQD